MIVTFEELMVSVERLMTAGVVSPQFAAQLLNGKLAEIQKAQEAAKGDTKDVKETVESD